MRGLWGITALLWASWSAAAVVREADIFVYMEGPIRTGDDKVFADMVDRSGRSGILAVDSSGGDLQTAMAIGRRVRKGGFAVSVANDAECASACVLILAAGVTRIVYERAAVIVHRPYIDGPLPSGADYDAHHKQMVRSLDAYLAEMNIPGDLASRMMVIPPHRAETLSKADLSTYLLNAPDPADEQRRMSEESAALGVSVADLSARKADAERVCKAAYQRSSDGNLIFFEYNVARACEREILRGQSPATMGARVESALARRRQVEVLEPAMQADCANAMLGAASARPCPVVR
jgi:hypothetical protein